MLRGVGEGNGERTHIRKRATITPARPRIHLYYTTDPSRRHYVGDVWGRSTMLVKSTNLAKLVETPWCPVPRAARYWPYGNFVITRHRQLELDQAGHR